MKRRLSRRTLLRGVGTVAIALPFLPEMASPSRCQVGAPPTRLITAFFGLGLDPDWQRDFSGPLQPLQPFASKMALCSTRMGQGNAGGAHCNTSTVVFVGEQQDSVNVAGGPSIDQKLRAAIDPSAPVLASGLWWRRGACDAQALRVYGVDGSGRPPVKRPSEVFDRIFGSYMPPVPDPGPEPDPGGDTPERRQNRIRRSVLDTVLAQYASLRGDRSYLGVESKRKIDQHFNSIREIERSLVPADRIIDDPDGGGGDPVGGVECDVPTAPTDPDIADYDRFTYGTGNGAPSIPWQSVEQVFHLHADLYAMALRCDLVRYGNLMFESAGGHTDLTGTYSALGESTNFPGTSQHDTYFHGNQRDQARLYQHFALSNMAYFLAQLDDRDFLEANGQTVLENATTVIGTEYGWNHSKNDVFHAVVGGGGRFASGNFTTREINCIDL
ncbi:MAG: DUF1552 domain-containing protein, partial [Myxococcota bacterium]